MGAVAGADIDMEQAGRLADVIDVDCFAGDMIHRAVMGQGAVHDTGILASVQARFVWNKGINADRAVGAKLARCFFRPILIQCR